MNFRVNVYFRKMKNKFLFKFLLLIFFLFIEKNTRAQLKEFRAVYIEQIIYEKNSFKLNMNIPNTKMELLYRNNESLWQMTDKEEALSNGVPVYDLHGDLVYTMGMENSDVKLYTNYLEKKVVENRVIAGKIFLLKSNLKTFKWKITAEQDTIAGYTCMKAVLQNDTNNVVAWFSPQIPFSAGPKGYGQLPGLILKLDINNGSEIYRATLFEHKPIQPDAIIIPVKGKEVTEEEFLKLQKENRD